MNQDRRGLAEDIPLPPLSRRLAPIVVAVCAGALLSKFLPAINLDSTFADLVVRLSDTAGAGLLPLVSVAVVIVVVTRRGPSRRRRIREAAVVIGVMIVAMAGGSALNEGVIKPVVGVPRPNIVALAESGTLGTEISTGDAFYEVGSVAQRRALMSHELTEARTPYLSDLVRDRWTHTVGYSMPSGHATAAMTFAILWAGLGLTWLTGLRRFAATVLIPAWAVAIAWSRVLLRVHTTADVTVGAVSGSIWGMTAWLVVTRLVPQREKDVQPRQE